MPNARPHHRLSFRLGVNSSWNRKPPTPPKHIIDFLQGRTAEAEPRVTLEQAAEMIPFPSPEALEAWLQRHRDSFPRTYLAKGGVKGGNWLTLADIEKIKMILYTSTGNTVTTVDKPLRNLINTLRKTEPERAQFIETKGPKERVGPWGNVRSLNRIMRRVAKPDTRTDSEKQRDAYLAKLERLALKNPARAEQLRRLYKEQQVQAAPDVVELGPK